jgi:hypothetical protein
MNLEFTSGELVDGTLDGWPVSFIATDYGVQGWELHLSAYSGENDEPAPDEVVDKSADACAAVSTIRKARKANVRGIIEAVGFVKDES